MLALKRLMGSINYIKRHYPRRMTCEHFGEAESQMGGSWR